MAEVEEGPGPMLDALLSQVRREAKDRNRKTE